MFLLIHQITGWEAHFDTSLRDPLMLIFFASIGLNANLASLRAGGKVLLMALYAIFVTYRVMGKNYDAAVLAAGHCSLSLGATPTAIANMQAITDRFGPSHTAFLIVPMVGAFFPDIANAIVIKLSLLLPMFTPLG
ncbi:Glutamate:Na+ symporter%2C ESS family [Yersinia enterocolitica]|nr:sodium/glutamate symport carrier protein [Yersinia enterocolitica]EKA27632.1 sodium/glutamate symporter [Yersinia enterocolitica subsp. enterocolitica WA-314]VTP77700.1 Glutamate:Na+ symporter, ESS family [Yersinia enterocolitica subsp. enterocolitica]KGA72181.1 sodium/glutamate symport carrier protein [Yersinia enterocolitica]KGA77730.1 sodium/glutamate symport carrier protein [Yersinia enterocolitica]